MVWEKGRIVSTDIVGAELVKLTRCCQNDGRTMMEDCVSKRAHCQHGCQ